MSPTRGSRRRGSAPTSGAKPTIVHPPVDTCALLAGSGGRLLRGRLRADAAQADRRRHRRLQRPAPAADRRRRRAGRPRRCGARRARRSASPGRLSDAAVARDAAGRPGAGAHRGGGVRDRRRGEPGRRAAGDRPRAAAARWRRSSRASPAASGPAARRSWRPPCWAFDDAAVDPEACVRNAARFDSRAFRRRMLRRGRRWPSTPARAARGERQPLASTRLVRRAARDATLSSGVTPAVLIARRRSLTAARVVLLAGPTALAFFSGGYFARARACGPGSGPGAASPWRSCAGAAAPPRAGRRWLAIGGLARAGRAGRCCRSLWAPMRRQRLRTPARSRCSTPARLLAAALLLRDRRVQPLVEPALAAGAADRDRLRPVRAAAARDCCTSPARSAPRAGSSSR